MARNELGLKNVSIRKLKPGQSALIGPFKSANRASCKISQLRRKYPDEFKDRQFTQVQMFLIDPKTCKTHRMFLVTRVDGLVKLPPL